MSAIPGRKKSVASSVASGASGLPQIDIPVVTNTLLNKAASQSASLYQQCSALRSKLILIEDFAPYLNITSPATSRQSTDPVTVLWDCLALGTPLCFLYNLLPPPATPIEISTDPAEIDPESKRDRKRAVALFVMGLQKLQKAGVWRQGELFTIGDLLERNTNGFVKVVAAVTDLVAMLPEDVFTNVPQPPSPPHLASHNDSPFDSPRVEYDSPTVYTSGPTSAAETERNNIIRELLETERKYVQDLEVMQNYARALQQNDVVDTDTIHHLFPGLNKLLDFQRRFLIGLEGTAEQPWKDQHWGHLFTTNELEFEVYEPYCANYTQAAELMLLEEQNLMVLSHVIHPKSELPAFLIKPVQRICKYPLLLESLSKRSSLADYPHHKELLEGLATAKRITDKVNEAQRRAENEITVRALEARIEDWKGHHLSNFGELLLDDIFIVTKSEVDREYHVFLFEKIILCCKENLPPPPSNKKVSKSNSILKKQQTPTTNLAAAAFNIAGQKKKNTPLLLKGRIFLNNVTSAVPSGQAGQHALQVWWRGDDDLEYFTLRCRTEEQLKQWETNISRLIREAALRRAQDRPIQANSTNPAPYAQQEKAHHEKTLSTASLSSAMSYQSSLPPYPGFPPVHHSKGGSVHPYAARGEDNLEGEGDWEENTAYSSYPPSGRGTPVGYGGRRSMPPERDPAPGYERPRARTEDAGGPVISQWRNMPPVPMVPTNALPPTPNGFGRPPLPRGMSNASATSDASFGPGASGTMGRATTLRSQFSSTRLRSTYENAEGGDRSSQKYGASNPNSPPLPTAYVPTRSRSASSPQAYVPPSKAAPPVPTYSGSSASLNRQADGSRAEKRESGSSVSTAESTSDYSPSQTASPITPYGSNDSVRPKMSQNFAPSTKMFDPPVKVKVHFGEDLFVIIVPRSTDYNDLVEKVGKKIRLCGGRRDDGPLRIKYKDEDGDMVTLGSNEDVQMAFYDKSVTLYVL